MAKLLVSTEVLKELLLPGHPAAWINSVRVVSADNIELELAGPAVPNCDRVTVITQQDWSTTTPAPARTVTFKEV